MIQADLLIIDGATPWLEYMATTKPDWMRKSLKSFGWYSQQQIKAGIKSSAPGGRGYVEFMPPDMRAKLEAVFGNRPKKRYGPLGKLVNAVGYEYDTAKNLVRVGWLSASAVKLGEKIEQGYTKAVTDKMRKYFWAAGVSLSAKSEINVAARHTFGPMQAMLAPKASAYIEDKILEYAKAGAPAACTKNKKYRVR
jgi:hypothetical protein